MNKDELLEAIKGLSVVAFHTISCPIEPFSKLRSSGLVISIAAIVKVLSGRNTLELINPEVSGEKINHARKIVNSAVRFRFENIRLVSYDEYYLVFGRTLWCGFKPFGSRRFESYEFKESYSSLEIHRVNSLK